MKSAFVLDCPGVGVRCAWVGQWECWEWLPRYRWWEAAHHIV